MEVNLEPVLDYIKAQNYKALEYEQNAKRVSAMSKWTVRCMHAARQFLVSFPVDYCTSTHNGILTTK